MSVSHISNQLALLDSDLTTPKVVDLLLNLANNHKLFYELLALSHSRGARRVLGTTKVRIRIADADSKDLLKSVNGLLKGNHTLLSPAENNIVLTVFFHPRLTDTVRNKLQSALNYPSSLHTTAKDIKECAVCAQPQTKDICNSCKQRLYEFTEYRCTPFEVPISHLNFNVRQYVNIQGTFALLWTSWMFYKNPGDLMVSVKPVQSAEPIQYPLPFPDYQLTISL